MSSTANARAICGALQPLVGTAATGKLLVRSTGATGTVAAGSCAIPVVGGSLLEDAAVFVAEPDSGDSWTVHSTGDLVDVVSLHGGTIANQAAATEYRWDPPLTGIEATSESDASAPVAGGTLVGPLKQVRVYKHASEAGADAFFRSQLSTFPGAVLAWESLAPRSGTLGPSPGPRTDRSGKARMLYRLTWVLYLVTSRLESEGTRRREADIVRDAVVNELFGRGRVRGLWVSTEPGVEILEARPFAVTPSFYVDILRLGTNITLSRRETTDYANWATSVIQAIEPEATPLDELTRLDVTVAMT
jgi:hypothetical protein